jgi:pimeloyl-ACP methyl ester carboxylesterase
MTRNWLDKTEYPFEPQYFELDGHKMHYIDEGKGDTLLFVHGTPSWSFDFRNVIKTLSAHYRCIAIDHIGFGLSDKPKTYDYSTLNHSHSLERFIVWKDLSDITLVMHDFGGPIGFHMAINNAQRIKRMVVMNSWLWSSASDPSYKKLRTVLKSPLLPFLYKYLNFSARYLMPSSFGDKKLKAGLHKQFTSPFGKASERMGTIGFAKSLLNDQNLFEDIWNKKQALVFKPILFIWGMKDKYIGESYLEKFVNGFEHTTIRRLEHCGHFPQEEEPELVANEIRLFMK